MLTHRRGYDPIVDPLVALDLGVEEIVVMGLDAHALQVRPEATSVCGLKLLVYAALSY
jgi:hypothetical protein